MTPALRKYYREVLALWFSAGVIATLFIVVILSRVEDSIVSTLETDNPEDMRAFIRECVSQPHQYPTVLLREPLYLITCYKEDKAHGTNAP